MVIFKWHNLQLNIYQISSIWFKLCATKASTHTSGLTSQCHVLRMRNKQKLRYRDSRRVHWLRFTCVSLVAVADDLSVSTVLITRHGKVASAVGTIWAGARTTLTAGCWAQNWIAIVTIGAPTEMTSWVTQVNRCASVTAVYIEFKCG